MNNVLSLRHSLLMIIIASALFRADASFADDSRRKEQSKIEGTVYASIADLTVLRDEVLSRYALMITGERQRAFVESANRPPLQIDRQYRLLAASKKDDFLYQAFGRVIGPEQSSRTFDFQYWAEYLKCSNVHKARVGPAALRGYSIKPDNLPAKKFVEQAGVGATRFDPFDELVAHVLFWSNAEKQKGWIEYIFLHSSELISAERITQGDIKSKWRWKHHSLDFEIELIQSKAVNFMPTKVKYTSKIPNMPGLFSEATITWKKHRTGKLLPHVVRGATGAPFGPTQQHEHLLFEWRLGDEIDDDFFDNTSADFRLQFTPLFEFYFDTYQKPGGLVTGTPWELPEELTRDPDKPAA